jgi:competence ComEA-like helix-hairpin-helix protein
MWSFNFTPHEIKALLFLLIALLIGSGITVYKKYHPNFAPELVFNQNPPVSFENQSQSNENPMVRQAHHNKDTEAYSQEVLPKISKDSITSPVSNQQKENRISSIHEKPLLKIPPKAGKQKIDLNSAPASELELLPGIGPVLSLRIINHRETKGKFQKIEDVMKVSGIGPKTFEKIKDLITIK